LPHRLVLAFYSCNISASDEHIAAFILGTIVRPLFRKCCTLTSIYSQLLIAMFANDIALLNAFQRGDTHATKIIFDDYFPPLCLFSERITADHAQSQDIVAESFEKAITRSNDFSSVIKLKHFLYQVVYNSSINYISARKRHHAAQDQLRFLSTNEHDEMEIMQREILRAELLNEIYRQMDNLPDKCGRIFKMIFIDQLSTTEIATQLAINMQTVRTQKARAISLIKNALLRKHPQATAILGSYIVSIPIFQSIFNTPG
jgi:RNA polymerase sigma factor (sigma-70 family)